MKHLFSFLLLFCMTAVNAQTILKGDMNDDKDVNIADVTSLVDVVLGKAPKETIGIGSPYMVDNSYVVGTWYAPDGTSFTLNEDGTTNFGTGFTYKFRPYQGTLMMFNASGSPVKTFVLNEVESAYLLAIDYATGAYTYYTNSGSLATNITITPSTLEMNSGTTTQLTATLSPEGAFGSVTWTSSDENVATVDANGVVTGVAGGTCNITATASSSLKKAICAVTVKQSVTSITLSQTIVILELDAFIRLTTTILPENAANKNLIWSSNNEDVATVRNGRIDAYGYGTAEITCEAADGSGVKATCVVYIINPETYVDLDLPSNTLWATYNVGATKPEEFGDYFSWGETEGCSSKNRWDWTTYKWCKGTYYSQTKYCTNSTFGYEGFVDGKTELEPDDDAAYVNWGPAWRMPSIEQLEELINSDYTTTEWTTQNGVNGYKITSKSNGNFIFLPAAGMYEVISWGRPGFGYYWSRTLVINSEGGARSVNFGSNQIISSSGLRSYGWSIRPVRSSE
jgi:uncharacterized protein YjdB